ncbi:major capsid protein [Paenibacillus paeoniae]|uniref:Major capsid protein n=1 Tax=Paenibacillus paeoniae TaxID=2292705 RepID=A0A371P1Z9_9BACL|nr:major capsid protein [Paenibacillus paeoniae]REK69336.1 major capsid protein [Paenibacillus paeoniae]
MPNILELFKQPEVLTYQLNRQYPPMLGETLFPEVKRESLEFDMIMGARRIPVVASVHAFDTEAEIGSREASKQAMELALIKRKLPLSEKEIVALENPRTPAEQQYLMANVYNDIDTLTIGVKARAEVMRMEAAANGTITLDENGLNATIDYHVPANHKEVLSGTDIWTDPNSDPITMIQDWVTTLGSNPQRVLTSGPILMALLRHPKVISALYGIGSGRIVTKGDLNAWLVSAGLPAIATYDNQYRKQKADGTYELKRYFPQDKFVLLPDGPLGETIYGPTAEEIRLMRDPSIDITKVGNILAMVYEENLDPVSTWTKAVATALPSFPTAGEVFQAKVI